MELELEESATVATLLEKVTEELPKVIAHPNSVVAAVNGEYVHFNQVLRDGDEVALIPPVSGGQR